MRVDTFNLTVILPGNRGTRQFNNISRTAVKRYQAMYIDEWTNPAFILEKVAARNRLFLNEEKNG